MIKQQGRVLRVPEGTESFHLEEAYRHRRIRQGLDHLFTSWGYLPVETPVFDFYDTYRAFLHDDVSTVYRLIDRGGDLLLLRSDITLFLAKQMGTNLTSGDLPARVWYSDTILRHQDREDISKNEFHQTGAELIGVPGRIGDLEILMLLIKTIQFLKLRNLRIHIGSRALFDSMFASFSEERRKRLGDQIRYRDFHNLSVSVREQEGVPSHRADQLSQLFSFIGTSEELNRCMSKLDEKLREKAAPHTGYIQAIVDEIHAIEPSASLVLDLTEIGTQSYHSGIVFQAYMSGLDSAFASGGRYDNLLASFGFSAPSVGFSLLLRKIEPLVGEPARFSPPESVKAVKADNFADAYTEAERIRSTGGIATL